MEMYKKSFNSNKFKILGPTWKKKFELAYGSYSVSNIQEYFESIIKKEHETVVDNPPMRIYVNKIENRITFKIETGYYLELITPETIKLLESIKHMIAKDDNGENVSHSEITEEILVYSNIVYNHYQHDSRVLSLFILPNKSFGQLLIMSTKNSYF